MPYAIKGFFEINEDMVQILLMFEVLFTRDSKVEDLFCCASSGLEPSLFFSNNFFNLWSKPVQDDFQHDFARMTDEADSSVVLAELQNALYRECNNQRLSPWGRPFSCSPDPVTDLYENNYHGLPASLNKFCWYIISSGRLPLFVMLLQSQIPHGETAADLLPGACCSPVLCCLHNSRRCTVLSNILSIC